MTNSIRRWKWECPECGDDDEDGKYLATDRERYCGVCAGDCGRDVRLKKWLAEPPTDSTEPNAPVL
ncbi:hypothetical protein ACSYAD_31555 [Acaryochloris marina NIES-2412]|uniref:hypothetical protein n=1 Tax=Acaryochloris marina TaxID=155978 RepID=UPI0040598FAA